MRTTTTTTTATVEISWTRRLLTVQDVRDGMAAYVSFRYGIELAYGGNFFVLSSSADPSDRRKRTAAKAWFEVPSRRDAYRIVADGELERATGGEVRVADDRVLCVRGDVAVERNRRPGPWTFDNVAVLVANAYARSIGLGGFRKAYAARGCVLLESDRPGDGSTLQRFLRRTCDGVLTFCANVDYPLVNGPIVVEGEDVSRIDVGGRGMRFRQACVVLRYDGLLPPRSSEDRTSRETRQRVLVWSSRDGTYRLGRRQHIRFL